MQFADWDETSLLFSALLLCGAEAWREILFAWRRAMKDKLGGRFGYWAFRDLRASYGFARIQGDLSEVLTEAAEGVRW